MATVSATPAIPVGGTVSVTAGSTVLAAERRHVWRDLIRKPTAILGGLVVLAWIAASVLAPALAPYDPVDLNVDIRLEAPSGVHWPGVDGLGRDALSRLLYGGRVSLPVAAVARLIA